MKIQDFTHDFSLIFAQKSMLKKCIKIVMEGECGFLKTLTLNC